MTRRCRGRRVRGFGLFDGMVSLALLAFGMLALTNFEVRLGGIANESAFRTQATVLADELLTSMLIDNANAVCYTLPAEAGCGNPTARASTDLWAARVMARLPNAAAPTSVRDTVTGRFTVTLSWYHKDSAEARRHQVQSDFRAP